ncbi:hypothetical protein LINPERPRIM_LOCUS2972 [Linum perenne]
MADGDSCSTLQIRNSKIIINKSFGRFNSDFRLTVVQNSTSSHFVFLELEQLYWLEEVFKVAADSQWSFPPVCETTSPRRCVSVTKLRYGSPVVKISEKCQNGRLFFVIIPMDIPASNGWLSFLKMIQALLISDPRSNERIQSSQIRSIDNNQIKEGEDEDPFSSLPDEIIHQILARLQSPEQVAQFNTLSRNWARILSSYPILEYKENEEDYYREKEPKQRFLTAMLKKLSQRTAPVDAIRIEIEFCSDLYTDFHDRFLDSAAKFSPLEIDISFGCGCYLYSPTSPTFPDRYCGCYPYSPTSPTFPYRYCGCYPYSPTSPTFPHRYSIEYEIPLGFFSTNGKQFVRLNVLKLKYCRFDRYTDLASNFSCLNSSLKLLCLEQVVFPNEEILHSIIHEASLLETLTLKNINVHCYKSKLQVQNHPNLKLLEVDRLRLDLLEIGGIQSLEEVRVTHTYMGEFRIWSVPNLKLVYSEGEIS